MRNVKRLWGVICCMFVCVLVLTSLLIARSSTEPDSTEPPEQQHTEKNDDRIVAKIGNREITLSELQIALERHYGPELLNQILDREAIRLEGIEAGIQIDNAQIERELRRMQQGYENDEDFYKSMREQLGLSKEELREDVVNKLRLEGIATREITITDEVVDTYIQTHSEEFEVQVELNIDLIIVSTKEQANKILNELAGGEQFAILARDRSLDDATANSGGELGWVEEDDPFVPGPVMETAKGLKVGEVSKPVSVNDRFAVVRLRDRREKEDPDRPFIRENVRKELALRDAPPLKDVVEGLRKKWGSVILDPNLQS
jgi:foldase protein PrsA